MKQKRQTYWNKQEIRRNRAISKIKLRNYNLKKHPNDIGCVFACEINEATLSMLEIGKLFG